MATELRSVPSWATWGLFAAWVVHDIEELATIPTWTAQRHRTFWGSEFQIAPMSPLRASVSIGAVGLLMAAAAEAGRRSGGSSRFYQYALAGFGWHSVTHLASSTVVGGYTPGVATVAPVVIPFYLSAQRVLRRHGVAIPNRRIAPAAVGLFAVSLAGAHAVAAGVEALSRRS